MVTVTIVIRRANNWRYQGYTNKSPKGSMINILMFSSVFLTKPYLQTKASVLDQSSLHRWKQRL